MSEKTITSQTKISDVIAAPPDTLWFHRDAEVYFEFYDLGSRDEGLVIYRYSGKGKLLWSASVHLLDRLERVIDLLRDARANYLEDPYGK